MTVKRTIDFLPAFFQTEQNKKFLSATLDQLISEPNLIKLNGYVGRKNAVNYKQTDNYLSELNSFRSTYQLEPSVISRGLTNNIDFVSGYQDLINKLTYQGVDTSNHDRLFQNEYYSYDGLVDFDKFVNFSQYYWLPNGPDSVNVFGTVVPIQQEFVISYDDFNDAARITGFGNIINPRIVLARGGRYVFSSETLTNIWIQTEPGTSGFKNVQSNVSSREIVGVSNNGSGEVIFNVPESTAQDQYLLMPKVADIDLVTTLKFKDIQGKKMSSLLDTIGSIDGQRNLVGKLIIFLNDSALDVDSDWDVGGKYDVLPYSDIGYDYSTPVLESQQYGIWRIPNNSDPEAVVELEFVQPVGVNEKVFVREGIASGNREYFKNSQGKFELVPVISVVQNILYYQDGTNPSAFGEILLVDPLLNIPINVDTDIIGKSNYRSPNGVVFTNGLKVKFDEYVTPTKYAGETFYVEGVGSGIRLVNERQLITPEPFTENSSQGFDITGFDSSNYDQILNAPKTPLYITIKRDSQDLNPWSRNNRWFHEDVIRKTSEYNNYIPVIDQKARASRPIIEFDSNIALFNFGRNGKAFVNLFCTEFTDVFGFDVDGDPSTSGYTLVVQGATSASVDGIQLSPGMRVIFAADTDENVRNKIYVVNLISPTGNPADKIIHLTLAEDGEVSTHDGIIVTQGNTYQGKSFWYNGENWQQSTQQLTTVNQEPLFDVFDADGVSLSDSARYPNSTFGGTKILSYRRGSGKIDNVLNFPLRYRNFNNVGDIVFDNNYVIDTFTYGVDETVTEFVSKGMLGIINGTAITRKNIWRKIAEPSKQYQQFTFFYGDSNKFKVYIKESTVGNIPNTQVYINNKLLNSDNYRYVVINDVYHLEVDDSKLVTGDKIDIFIHSYKVSESGQYQVPVNLDNNSVNLDFSSITLGQMRNHVARCFENSVDIIGTFPGPSNIRDINVKDNPGRILQHSAPLTYAMLFLNNDLINFNKSLDNAKREYTRFKNKFLELVGNADYIDENNIPATLDRILIELNSYKTADMPWFRSDMVPYGDDRTIIIHNVVNTAFYEYELTRIFDPSQPSNKSILVYLKDTLLLKDIHYTFSEDRPAIILSPTISLTFGDEIKIVEYNNTDGCWIPETPTKLGLYPLFTPEIRDDFSYIEPQRVLQGHDGSTFIIFGDYRDDLLLELEKRIYNNVKVKYDSKRMDINSLIPGKFRKVGFSRMEFSEILAKNFLAWAGFNRVNYQSNSFYNNSNGFTWNYSQFIDKISGELLPGAWRGIFKYFFDCEDPAHRPWEMLGFSEEPAWWRDAYGPAPYTSGNLVMWEDLEAGRIIAGDRAGIDLTYARPGLLNIIPVNEYGDLLSPHEFIVNQYEVRNTTAPFVAGDYGPAESAWARTSEYPFAIQNAISLVNPAKYFGLQLDTHGYFYDVEVGQYLFKDTNKRITQTDIKINGEEYNSIVHRGAGYVNWIADYVRSQGRSALVELGTVINNFTVQLSYKMAGFSDKKMLKMFAEQASPTSTNESVVIPDEDYNLVLSKGVPVNKMVYSAVIVTRTDSGWSVEGYNVENPFFKFKSYSDAMKRKIIFDNGVQFSAPSLYSDDIVEIPYGTEFTSRQQVVDFLLGYEQYLISIGFIFEDRSSELNEELNWALSAKEFLTWSQQGWGIGNVLVLSPVTNKIILKNDSFIVDAFNDIKTDGKVVDINFRSLRPEDFRVSRAATTTTVTLLSQTIGLVSAPAVQYEHVIVFENKTVFNDIVYQPELGNRQSRIKIVGQKTGSWDGSLTAPGFIINQGQIPSWQPGKDYKKADIVEYKGQWYVASKDIVSQDEFNYLDWMVSDYSDIKQGLLPNFAQRAGQIENYYDLDNINLESDVDMLSKGLLGFRNRNYLSDIGLDDVSQVKFYQGFIKEKGTRKAIESLTRAQIDRLNSDITFYEDWAVRVGEYGALDSTQAIEVKLSERQFASSPAFLTIIEDNGFRPTDRIGVKFSELYKKPKQPSSKLFLTASGVSNLETEFKTAGPVRLDDADYTLFSIDDYRNLDTNYNEIGDGDIVWVAKDRSADWNVFRITRSDLTLSAITNIGDNLILVDFDQPHQFVINDLLVLKNVPLIAGTHKVVFTPSVSSVVVEFSLGEINFDKITNLDGYALSFNSLKYEYPSQISDKIMNHHWADGDKLWVTKHNSSGEWAVFEKTSPWKEKSITNNVSTSGFGTGIAKNLDNSVVAILSSVGVITIYENDNGTLVQRNTVDLGQPIDGNIKIAGPETDLIKNIFVTDKATRSIFVLTRTSDFDYTVETITNALVEGFGHSFAVSSNGRWIYVGAPETNIVCVYYNDGSSVVSAGTLVPTSVSAGDMFGHSVVCTSNGRRIAVGAPNVDYNSVNDVGHVYTFDKVVEAFISTGFPSFNTVRSLSTTPLFVTVDGVEQSPGTDYTITLPNTITMTTPPAAGKVVSVEFNLFVQLDKIVASDAGNTDLFGSSLAICPNDCSLYIGAPAYDSNENSERDTGAVYRYVNQSRIYGVIEGTISNPVVTPGSSIRIDDFEIVFTGSTLSQVVSDINNIDIPGISASVAFGNKLMISSNNSNSFAKLRIAPGLGNAMSDLGLYTFVQTQIINAPYPEQGSRFGDVLEVSDDSTKLLVSSPTANSIVRMTFDGYTDKLYPGNATDGLKYLNDPNSNPTGSAVSFDDESTTIKSTIYNSGVAYVYQLIPSPENKVSSPSKLLLAQTLVPETISTGDRFGTAMQFLNSSRILVSAIEEATNGCVYTFQDADNNGAWLIKRSQTPKVNVESINAVYLYDTLSYEKVGSYDFIDPAKGRILGVASQEIDFKLATDPAFYTESDMAVSELSWAEKQVGKVWWDLSTIRWMEYEQGEFAYRSSNWGRKFPGSSIDIYEWTESNFSPLEYVTAEQDGTPYNFEKFSTRVQYNPVLGKYETKYYFWVKNKVQKPSNSSRNLSVLTLSEMIDSPETSGIPFVAFVDESSIGMWNLNDFLVDDRIALHVDYDIKINSALIHSEYQLIQEGNEDTIIPTNVINKIIDSLCGEDAAGNAVPDHQLTSSERYGLLIRPRQSVFKDQQSALKLLVDALNSEFKDRPILQLGFDVSKLYSADVAPVSGFNEAVEDLTSLGYLTTSDKVLPYRVLVEFDATHRGWSIYELDATEQWNLVEQQTINTQLYWGIIDWYAEDFVNTGKYTYVVESEYDIARLNLVPFDTIKIKNNGNGKFKIYQVGSDGTLITVGLESATIRIFDTLWKQQPAKETRNILNSAVSIFAGTKTFNDLFFALIRFALSEQKYVDWIFKTSFITVLHKIRKLDQYATYQKDNQNFVREFIEEVKPYRTKIREYLLGYETIDEWNSDVTDFDLPGYWDVDYLRFRSPSGEKIKDAELYLLPENVNWFNNYTYYVSEIVVDNGGSGYTITPRVVIEGGGGSGAEARAVVSNGILRRVIVTSPGTGYTSTPTIRLIGGNGTGARVYARITNDAIRKIKTVINFNRITYAGSEVNNWTGNTIYAAGDVIRYNNINYVATAAFTSGDTFNTLNLVEYSTAADMVSEYYQPRAGMIPKDLNLLFSGTAYTGNFVTGTKFANDPFEGQEDTAIRSYYTDIALGTRPEDIIVDGGEYVDVHNSHSPEEVVPGIVFDALDIRVFTLPPENAMGFGAAPDISVVSVIGDGVTTSYDVSITGKHNDTVYVFSKTRGQLYENVDFTLARSSNEFEFTAPPALGESVYIYLYGDASYGKILDKILQGDSSTASFEIPDLEFGLVTDTYVTFDGVRQFGYQFVESDLVGSKLVFDTPPTAGTHIHVYAFRGTPGRQSFSEMFTQFKTVTGNTYPIDYSVALERPMLYAGPLSANVIVEVNNRRLRPANNAYYTADGIETTFAVPGTVDVNPAMVASNDIEVYVAGVRKVNLVDYVINPVVSESDNITVTLNSIPAVGTEVIVTLHAGSEFRASMPTQIDLNESVGLMPGDVIKIITFTNHDPLRLRTQVFVGATAAQLVAEPGFEGSPFDMMGFDAKIITTVEQKIYEFNPATIRVDNSAPNPNYLWVTLNGVRMMPNYDFVLLDHGKLQLGTHLEISNVDVIIITSMTENKQIQPIGFRIFKDMNGGFSYLRLSAENSTHLSQDLLITDTIIHVNDVSGLPVPSPELASPGIVTINGERITYYEIDYVNNTLGRLRRATAGTGAPSIHTAGTLVVDAGPDQKIPGAEHYTVWADTEKIVNNFENNFVEIPLENYMDYTTGNLRTGYKVSNVMQETGITTATSGVGLSYSNTVPAKFLKAKPSFLPV